MAECTIKDSAWELRQDVRVSRPDDRRLSFNEAAEIYDELRPLLPCRPIRRALRLAAGATSVATNRAWGGWRHAARAVTMRWH